MCLYAARTVKLSPDSSIVTFLAEAAGSRHSFTAVHISDSLQSVTSSAVVLFSREDISRMSLIIVDILFASVRIFPI